MEKFNSVITFIEMFKYAFIAGTVLLFIFGFVKFFFRKELRLYKNLQRKIMFIVPSDNNGRIRGRDMDMEIERLKDSKLFKISDRVSDYKNFDPQSDYGLIVLGYDKDMLGLSEILTKVKHLQVPLIIYTYGENVSVLNQSDKAALDSYPWVLFANFKLTLMNSIFTTLATYSYGKREDK